VPLVYGCRYKTKKVPDIKYYHTVPVDHLTALFDQLTARLAAEGRSNPTNSIATTYPNLRMVINKLLGR
jgi:hypothetical protein